MECSDLETCPDVTNALRRRLPMDELFPEPHDKVARVNASDGEDKERFDKRISKAARLYHHVFSKDDLINYYTQGLLTAVRETVSHQVRQMTLGEQRRVPEVRQVSVSVRRSQGALLKGQEIVDKPPIAKKTRRSSAN